MWEGGGELISSAYAVGWQGLVSGSRFRPRPTGQLRAAKRAFMSALESQVDLPSSDMRLRSFPALAAAPIAVRRASVSARDILVATILTTGARCRKAPKHSNL